MAGAPLEQTVYERLAAGTAVAALVGTRIYPILAPQGAARPYVVFARQETENLADLSGRGTHDVAQVAVMCFADEAETATALARAVRDRLDGWGEAADTVQSCRLIGRLGATVGEPAADPVIIADTLLFRILARETW